MHILQPLSIIPTLDEDLDTQWSDGAGDGRLITESHDSW